MANSVYRINKGINKPIEFKGLKAQYIWYLGGGVLCLMILFAILYIIRVNSFVCIGLIGILGTIMFMHIAKMSRVYGEHGMKKKLAKRKVPKFIKCYSRKIFIQWNKM